MSVPMTPLDRRQQWSGAVLLALTALALMCLGVRVAQINTTLQPRLLDLARAQRRGHSDLPARRGMIFDVRGRVVAVSRRMPDVFVDPSRIDDVGALARDLAPRLNLSAEHIAKRIHDRADTRFVLLASRVDRVTADAVRALHHRAVGLMDREQRVYPLGDSMAHVLGWVGRDGKGMEGIELAFDDRLAGEDGRRTTVRDAARRALWRTASNQREAVPHDGMHVVLTIDAEIQRITEKALAEAVTQYEGESGVAIVLSPGNGEVLAMASYPTFDANEPPTIQSLALRRNRALTDPVEPGSTFKPFIACGALAGGFVTQTEMIDCHMGSHRFGRRLVTDTRPHGMLDLRGIISRSSNIGMGVIAHRMGNAVLHETIRRFGFGEPTGLGTSGEHAGLVRPLDKWNSYSTNSVAMGYEILVTPLQLASAFAAIVNDGVLLRPRLIKRFLDPDGTVLQSFDSPEVVRRVVPRETARYVARELLVAVVEDGGGHRARVGPYRVLGKTGTAKLTYPDRGGYEPGAYLGLFLGAAPVEHPEIIVVAMIRRPNPEKGYYGGTIAAPAVGRIIHDTLRYLDVPVRGGRDSGSL